jgi:transcriptional regulator with XRE-family HTH domain
MADLADVGRRLRILREAAQMPVESAAQAVGASRALIYRYEGGDIVKLDTLERLARLYGTSATSLLGLGHEYITNSVVFFERLEKLEREADHITTVFGPLAYVLSSDDYEDALVRALARDDGADALTGAELARLRRTLRRRKAALRERRPGLVNIIPLAEIRNYLTGPAGLTANERVAQRRTALKEMQHLGALIAKPPMGVQIGLTLRPLPTAGFQVLRIKDKRLLVQSPFRLGEPVNLRYGVAMISDDEQAVRMHESLIARLWDGALTGSRAIDEIERAMKGGA